jgi:hypothetical protein
MKTKLSKTYIDRTEIWLCDCGSPDHQIVFQLSDWGQDPNTAEKIPADNLICTMSVYLNDRPFWQRLWMSIKYVFGYKSRYGHWDSFIVDFDTATKMIEGMERYRTLLRGYVKQQRVNQFLEDHD